MHSENQLGKNLRQLYNEGINIMAYLRDACGIHYNSEEIIAASYDLQAGSYIRERDDHATLQQRLLYTRPVAAVIQNLGATSILEAGVGEATTLCDVIEYASISPEKAWGFDVAWSRVAVGREYALRRHSYGATLFTGSMFNIPVCANALDVVYTSHSIEPNRGASWKPCANSIALHVDTLSSSSPFMSLPTRRPKCGWTSMPIVAGFMMRFDRME